MDFEEQMDEEEQETLSPQTYNKLYYEYLALKKMIDCALAIVQFFPLILPPKDIVFLIPALRLKEKMNGLLQRKDISAEEFHQLLCSCNDRLETLLSTALVKCGYYGRDEIQIPISYLWAEYQSFSETFRRIRLSLNVIGSVASDTGQEFSAILNEPTGYFSNENLDLSKIPKSAHRYIAREQDFFIYYLSFIRFRGKIFGTDKLLSLQDLVDVSLRYLDVKKFEDLLRSVKKHFQDLSYDITRKKWFSFADIFYRKFLLSEMMQAQLTALNRGELEKSWLFRSLAKERLCTWREQKEHQALASGFQQLTVLEASEAHNHYQLRIFNEVKNRLEQNLTAMDAHRDFLRARRNILFHVTYLLLTSSTAELSKMYLKLLFKLMSYTNGFAFLWALNDVALEYYPNVSVLKPAEMLVKDCMTCGPLTFFALTGVLTKMLMPGTQRLSQVGSYLYLPSDKVARWGVPALHFGVSFLEHFCYAWFKFSLEVKAVDSEATTHIVSRVAHWLVDTMRNNRTGVYFLSSFLLTSGASFGTRKMYDYLWRDRITPAGKTESNLRRFSPLIVNEIFKKIWGDYFPDLFGWVFDSTPDKETLLNNIVECEANPRACKSALCDFFRGEGSIRKQYRSFALHEHPDKKGTEAGMVVMNQRYEFAKKIKVANEKCRTRWSSCTIL